MKILLYTQIRGPVGSLRLLLNLAEHLRQYHEVGLAFSRGKAGEALLQQYPYVSVMDCSEAPTYAKECDVMVCHLPHTLDPIIDLSIPRKLVVSMEVASEHSLLIRDDNIHLFDRLLYLHEEQVSHLNTETRCSKCQTVPLINNIEKIPPFSRSGNIGCVGTNQKHNINIMLALLSNTKSNRKILVWSPKSLYLPQGIQNRIKKLQMKFYCSTHRLLEMGINPDIYAIMKQYDLLLHTPSWSNGTSTVVSDALASGKMVLLSPIPAFKKAYGHLPGVYFLDQKDLDVEKLLSNYNKDQYEVISNHYASLYNRTEALAHWQQIIEEE